MAMQDHGFNLDNAVAVPERTPTSLSALLAGVGERWVKAMEGDDSWSPCEVIVHLINGERINWMVRARHILSGERRPFEPLNRTTQFSESQVKSLAELLAT